MADDGARAPDDLYGLPLEEFTSARDALAKELRKSGDRERAEEVKRLRKPSLAAWALNQAARRHGDEVARLLEVGAALREAQRAALSGDASRLREAGRQLGEVVDRVAGLAAGELEGAGREASAAQRERIAATLRAAAADEEGGERLRRGVLTEDLEPAGFGLADLGFEVTRVPAGRPADGRRGREGRGGRGGRASPEAKEAVEAARRELRRAEAEADTAETRARRRAERAEAAERRAAEAHREAEGLRGEAEEAAGEAEAARRRAREAADRLAAAESALTDAESRR